MVRLRGTGRSKGCAVCRRRKIKCDEKQPSCSQCLRLPGISCPGATVDTVYLVANAENPQKHTRLENSHLQQQDRQPRGESPDNSVKNYVTYTCTRKGTSLEVINAAGLHENQIVVYLISFFAKSNANQTKPTDWMIHLLSTISHGSHIAHKSSILSASLALYSTTHRDNAVYAHEARKWYGICLRRMRVRLDFLLSANCYYQLNGGGGKPKRGRRTQVCAEDVSMALMLAHYEIFTATSTNAYVEHVLAAGSFLQALGPESCQGGCLSDLFRTIRVHMLYVSIIKGYSPILASEPWKSIPFRFRPKTLLDNVVDVITSFLYVAPGSPTVSMPILLPYIIELHSIKELLWPGKATTPTSPSGVIDYAIEMTELNREYMLYGFNLWQYHIPIDSLLSLCLPDSVSLDPETVVSLAYYGLAWILVLHHQKFACTSNTTNEKPNPSYQNTNICSHQEYISNLNLIIQAHCSTILTAGAFMDSCEEGCTYIRMMIPLRLVADLSPDRIQTESALWRLELWRSNKGLNGDIFKQI